MDKDYVLNEDELKLFTKVRADKVEEVKAILSGGNVRINCLDDHGMTPVQHAAYKGSYDMCRLFIDCGADININHHDHKYTTLMFACLSGNMKVVNLLLENGVTVNAVNSINRTAAQLAAFVGNHDIVSLINNFVPREEVDWYTMIHGKEKEPKLPLTLAKPFHQLVTKTNINPVRLAMFLQSNTALLDEAKKVTRVLDHLCGIKLNDSGNEMLSMKLHHISFVVRTCEKFRIEQGKKSGEKETNASWFLEPLIKHWIKDHNDCVPIALEKLMRQSIREYPFVDCALFQQFVRTLAPVEVGAEPSALTLFTQAVSGQRDLDDIASCDTCGELRPEKKCSICKSVQYCDKYCQKLHWPIHKPKCPNLAKRRSTSQEIHKENVENMKEIGEKLTNITLTECSQQDCQNCDIIDGMK